MASGRGWLLHHSAGRHRGAFGSPSTRAMLRGKGTAPGYGSELLPWLLPSCPRLWFLRSLCGRRSRCLARQCSGCCPEATERRWVAELGVVVSTDPSLDHAYKLPPMDPSLVGHATNEGVGFPWHVDRHSRNGPPPGPRREEGIILPSEVVVLILGVGGAVLAPLSPRSSPGVPWRAAVVVMREWDVHPRRRRSEPWGDLEFR